MGTNAAFIKRITDRVNGNIGEPTVVKTTTEVVHGIIKPMEKPEEKAFYVNEDKVNMEEIEYIFIADEVIRKSDF